MWRLVVLLSLLACAHNASDSAEYKEVFLPEHKEKWRFCSQEFDGLQYHRKGLCYQGKECKKRFLVSDLCRPKLRFCAWGDLACMDKHKLWGRKIVVDL